MAAIDFAIAGIADRRSRLRGKCSKPGKVPGWESFLGLRPLIILLDY